MTIKNKETIYLVSIVLIILSFIFGYINGENSAGAGEGDYDHILNNYNLIFNNSIYDIDWSKYRDSRFPLDYFLFKFYLPNSENVWRLNIFLISFIIPFFLFFTLNYKSNFINFNSSKKYLLLISLIIFFSPYFRTSAFWMLRENLGYLFWILSTYFLFKSKFENFKFLNIFCCTFFSFISFYSSVNLFIIPMINFFLLVNYSRLFCKQNIILIVINLIFFSPLIIFYDFFLNTLQYINSEELKRITFNIYKIVDIYSIILIYIIPIVLIYFSVDDLKKILKNNFLKIIIFIFIYLILFWNYPNDNLLSGGAIRKILNIFISNQFYFKLFYLILSGFSFLITFYFVIKMEKILLFFIIPYTIFFTFVNYVFQEYFDPVFILFVILYSKNFLEKCKKNLMYLLSYFLLFFSSSYLYYSIIL